MTRSVHQLFYVHSGPKLRVEAYRYLFAPLVSKEYIQHDLAVALYAAVEKLKAAVKLGHAFEPNQSEYILLEDLGLTTEPFAVKKVMFSITDKFEVIPTLMTFEYGCLLNGLNPEVVKDWLYQRVLRSDVLGYIKRGEIPVQEKKKPREVVQLDAFLTDNDTSDQICETRAVIRRPSLVGSYQHCQQVVMGEQQDWAEQSEDVADNDQRQIDYFGDGNE